MIIVAPLMTRMICNESVRICFLAPIATFADALCGERTKGREVIMKKGMLAAGVACALAIGCLGVVGCSSGSATPAGEAGGEVQEATQPEAPAPDSKYVVSIDGCEVAQDYEGNPAIVVTYTWTNNSDDKTSFMVAIDDAAFQNGVELDFATISVSDERFDTNAAMNEVQPGATQTVQQAFLLDDQSDVTIECTELISFDDTVLAEATFSVA